MPAFRSTVDIGTIAAPPDSDPQGLRHALKVSPDDRIVVIAFGGIPLISLPWDRIEAMAGYRFIVPGPVPPQSQRVVSSGTLPFTFPTIMASGDLLLTKPGYGTIVEAVALGMSVVYVRRYNFADENSLVNYLQRYGRGVELLEKDFLDGRWEQTMQAVMTVPAPQIPAPRATGATEAADIVRKYL